MNRLFGRRRRKGSGFESGSSLRSPGQAAQGQYDGEQAFLFVDPPMTIIDGDEAITDSPEAPDEMPQLARKVSYSQDDLLKEAASKQAQTQHTQHQTEQEAEMRERVEQRWIRKLDNDRVLRESDSMKCSPIADASYDPTRAQDAWLRAALEQKQESSAAQQQRQRTKQRPSWLSLLAMFRRKGAADVSDEEDGVEHSSLSMPSASLSMDSKDDPDVITDAMDVAN